MRALNMESLSVDIEREWPGVTIYGIGDKAHALRKSGHNEDDTPGVIAELQDADTKREHRSIDVMVRGPFTKADADGLVARILADPSALRRLFYIIWNGYIWERSNGWRKRKYTGSDQHTDHIHLSGWMEDDDNTAGWPAVASKNSGGREKLFCEYGQTGDAVTALQLKLANFASGKLFPGADPGNIDGDYRDKTAAAVAAFEKYCGVKSDGKKFGPHTLVRLDAVWAKYWAKGVAGGKGEKGEKGDPGPAGPPGPPGELTLPATLVFRGTLEQGS